MVIISVFILLLPGSRRRLEAGADFGLTGACARQDPAATRMLRWLIGGGREPQGLAETIGEEQTQNPYTELLVLKAHHDIVRFLVQLDDYRFASAGDDGIVVVWNAQTGEKLLELHGHTQKITAITTFPSLEACEEKNQLILTASADRTVIVWDCDTGRQVRKVPCLQSTVKCLTVLRRLDVWLSGGNDLCVWNQKLDLLCKTHHLSDTGISALIEIPKNCVVAAVSKELIIFKLIAPTEGALKWDILEVKRLLDHQDNILSLVNVNGAGAAEKSAVVFWPITLVKRSCPDCM